MLAALAGGVGAARLLSGLVEVVDPSALVAIVNTGDDAVLHGLHVSPDLDTVTYTLANMANELTGWGVRDETWTVMEALDRLGGETWFRLGDRDLATHLYRTGRLRQGARLSQVTKELTARLSVPACLLPMSDDPVRTCLTLADGTEIEFQDYFVRRRHQVAVRAVRFAGAAEARPAPGVLEALREAERIIVCPSNPIVSIGPILALRALRQVLVERRAHVVAVSPIVAGAALKGPADRLLAELGHEPSVVGVARLYREIASTLVIDHADAARAGDVEAAGLRCVVTDTIMADRIRTRALAAVVAGRARP